MFSDPTWPATHSGRVLMGETLEWMLEQTGRMVASSQKCDGLEVKPPRLTAIVQALVTMETGYNPQWSHRCWTPIERCGTPIERLKVRATDVKCDRSKWRCAHYGTPIERCETAIERCSVRSIDVVCDRSMWWAIDRRSVRSIDVDEWSIDVDVRSIDVDVRSSDEKLRSIDVKVRPIEWGQFLPLWRSIRLIHD